MDSDKLGRLAYSSFQTESTLLFSVDYLQEEMDSIFDHKVPVGKVGIAADFEVEPRKDLCPCHFCSFYSVCCGIV